jgi:GNAT superfamily N-acetyltransferase
MAIRIRPVDRHDTARLVVLLDQLGYPTDAADVHERLSYWLPDQASVLLGADDAGELIGVAALHVCPMLERTGRFGRLVAMVVDDRYRGQGVGRSLLTEIERRAYAAGCIVMEVTSSVHRDAAHRFYAGLGYQDTADRSRRFTKPLPPAEPVPPAQESPRG